MSTDRLGSLSVRRNELIADMFARMHRVERMGSGFKRIRESMEKAKLPFPKISSDKFFIIEFQRPIKTISIKDEGVNEGLSEGLNEGLKTLLKSIKMNPGIKAKDLSAILDGRPIKTIERQIKSLIDANLIERKGSKKTGGYYSVQ